MADPRGTGSGTAGSEVTDSQVSQPRTTAPAPAPSRSAPAAPLPPDAIAWDARGLAPAVVQDARTGEVLMLAWQNREALARTLATGTATFFSRSRDSLWVKGATSGNTQAVRAVATDCDADAILLQVTPAGPACHTGARSCFFQPVAGAPALAAPPTLAASEPGAPASAPATQSVATATESVAGATESVAGFGAPPAQPGAVLAALEVVLRSRRESPPPGSYTAKLFADETLRHKKVGEEATELVIASLRGSREEIAGEAADLVFHALVLLQAHGMGLADIERVLHARENGPRRG